HLQGGCEQLGILRLQVDELAEQGDVLGISDLRLVELVILPVRALDEAAQLENASLCFLVGFEGGVHTLTMGARLTARIFMPTRSNFTMISSSVRVIVLFSTLPRPQDRCSTGSPGR